MKDKNFQKHKSMRKILYDEYVQVVILNLQYFLNLDIVRDRNAIFLCYVFDIHRLHCCYYFHYHLQLRSGIRVASK